MHPIEKAFREWQKSEAIVASNRPALRDQMCVWDNETFDGLVCPPSEDKARQEFKEEADLEFQIRRFGAGLPFQSGSVDYTLDLTKAYEMVERAQQAWAELPAAVQTRFANWSEVERAAASGDLATFLKGLEDARSAASKPSASDSAPVTPPAGV